MRFFFVTTSVQVVGVWHSAVQAGSPSDSGEFKLLLRAPPVQARQARNIPYRFIYLCTDVELRAIRKCLQTIGQADCLRVLAWRGSNKILSSPGLPKNIGYDRKSEEWCPMETKVEEFARRKELSLVIVNGMGRELGDSIVGLRSLNILYDKLSRMIDGLSIDLYQSLPASKAKQLYEKETVIHEIHQLPMPVGHLMGYDAYIDLSDMFLGPPSFNQAMIDLFLEEVSIDKTQVADEDKRVSVSLNPKVAQEIQGPLQALKSKGKKLLLFHALASSKCRSIPDTKIGKIVEAIIQRTEFYVVSALKTDFAHTRFKDISDLSLSFDHFAYIISRMDAVVTVDTVTYHVADSFSIPTVVLFTTMKPENSVRYYPFSEGIHLDKTNRILGKHSDHGFSDEDLRYTESLWDNVDIDEVVHSLREMQQKRVSTSALTKI